MGIYPSKFGRFVIALSFALQTFTVAIPNACAACAMVEVAPGVMRPKPGCKPDVAKVPRSSPLASEPQKNSFTYGNTDVKVSGSVRVEYGVAGGRRR